MHSPCNETFLSTFQATLVIAWSWKFKNIHHEIGATTYICTCRSMFNEDNLTLVLCKAHEPFYQEQTDRSFYMELWARSWNSLRVHEQQKYWSSWPLRVMDKLLWNLFYYILLFYVGCIPEFGLSHMICYSRDSCLTKYSMQGTSLLLVVLLIIPVSKAKQFKQYKKKKLYNIN